MSGESKLLKIVLIGDCNTGKTTLMERFGNNRVGPDFRSTVGIDYREKNVKVKEKMYTLQIWDTAGQERFNSLTRSYYRWADCCLFTFALDDLRSFENISKWIMEFRDNGDGNTFPFVIVGNKVDKVDNRKVNKRMVKDLCNQNGISFCHFYETSAKDGTNVEEAFIAVAERYIELETTKRYIESETSKRITELENRRDVVRKRHTEEKSLDMKFPQESTVDLSKKTNEKSGCC